MSKLRLSFARAIFLLYLIEERRNNVSGKIELHQAESKDGALINSILVQTVQWLQSRGSTQWSGILEGKDNHNTSEAIERGEVFYVTIEHQPVGMFILWDQQSEWDAALWKENPTTDYSYLHRLTIVREFAGQGVSELLLKEAKACAKAMGKKAVRLDCIADNPHLNKLYQHAGFSYKGQAKEIEADGHKTNFNLYQFDIN